MSSCTERQEATPVQTDSIEVDSTALRVAVMPTMGCLPLYYAVRSGLTDSLGLQITLLRYQAQMDIDTAILRGHADIAYTLKPFAACDEPLSLISLKTKRVKRINQMKEQMIAVSRLSATDYWCDRLLDSTSTNHDDIYRPQINDVRLRAEMMRMGLIDAAMMGEPFATWMVMLGHKRLFRTQRGQTRLYAWVASDNATDIQQKAFCHLLDSAVVLCNQSSQADLIRNVLQQEYQLPPALTDTLELPAPTATLSIRPSDATEARKWLDKTKQRSK